MVGEPLHVTLQSGDAALVVRNGGISELHRRNYEKGEEMPIQVKVLTAIALRLASDMSFVRDQLQWLERQEPNVARPNRPS